MASHEFEKTSDKGKKQQQRQERHQSKLILMINNWVFNRDNQNRKNIKCTLADINVEIKLSSTTFARKNETVEDENDFRFDGHGARFPLNSLVHLLNSPGLISYLEQVLKLHEEDCGPIAKDLDDEEEEPDEAASEGTSEETEEISRKRKSTKK